MIGVRSVSMQMSVVDGVCLDSVCCNSEWIVVGSADIFIEEIFDSTILSSAVARISSNYQKNIFRTYFFSFYVIFLQCEG